MEDQDVEYKDFSRSTSFDKKHIVSKLFKEIAAFTNSKGGKVIVGIDDVTRKKNPQTMEVCDLLANDRITSEINRISDHLIVFKSVVVNGIITIDVLSSDDPISCAIDYKGLKKGDCFIRKNHESTKAVGVDLKRLIEEKNLSVDLKRNKLRKIVHWKFAKGKNSSDELNVFDSIEVISNSKDQFAPTVFDEFMFLQFIHGFKLPLSKFSTMTLYLNTAHYLGEEAKKTGQYNNIVGRKEALNRIKSNQKDLKNFIDGCREELLNSIGLKNYLSEQSKLLES